MKYVQKIKISARERVSERAAMRFFFRGDNRRYYVCVRFIAPRRSLWSQLEPTSSKGRREMARDNSKSLCIHLSVAMRRECICAERARLSCTRREWDQAESDNFFIFPAQHVCCDNNYIFILRAWRKVVFCVDQMRRKQALGPDRVTINWLLIQHLSSGQFLRARSTRPIFPE